MKNKKSVCVKLLILICVLFGVIAMTNRSHAVIGAVLGAGALKAGSIVLTIILAIQYVPVILASALKGIMAAVSAAVGGGTSNAGTEMFDIFFNHNAATSANFFGNAGDTMDTIAGNVVGWYKVMRELSIAALLFVLLYIGIRMAISTVAEDEAKYKKMFTDWAMSLILVFVLHYIMYITFYVSNTLVETLESVVGTREHTEWGALLPNVAVPLAGLDEAILYCAIIVSEFLFFLVYIKRIVTLSFLMIIAPLITVTYAIDKVGDGKSQALNTWLKEFIFTVIIQPVHCILYIVLVVPAVSGASETNSLGTGIFYIVMLNFIRNAETIVKKIFGISAASMPDSSSTATLALGVMSNILSKAGKANKSANETGKKMPKMADEAGAGASNSGTHIATQNEQGSDTQSGVSTNTNNGEQGDNAQTNNVNDTTDANSNAEGGASNENSEEQNNNRDPNDTNNGGQQENNNESQENKKSKSRGEFARAWQMLNHGEGGLKGLAKDSLRTGLNVGAGAFGAMAGMTLGDAKTAVGVAAASSAGMNKIQSAIGEFNDGYQKLSNQEYYAAAVNDFANYIRSNSDHVMTDAEVKDEMIQLRKDYDEQGNLEGFTDEEIDFLELSEQMEDTYDYLGSSDASSAVDQTIRMAIDGELHTARKYRTRYNGTTRQTSQPRPTPTPQPRPTPAQEPPTPEPPTPSNP